MNSMAISGTGIRKGLLVLLLAFLSPSAWAQSPNALIEDAMELMSQKIENNKEALRADRAALYSVIDEILLPRFDRRYAARLVLGRNVRKASEEQLERFIEAFYTSMVHKYADGVLEFNHDKIQVLKFRGDDTKPRVVVKTIVTLDDGKKVPVDYGLVHRKAGWLMFDVTIEGISYVRNFRAQMNEEIQESSLESVIDRLEKETGIVAAQ